MENNNLARAYYSPSESYEWIDIKTGQFYNRSGDELRNSEEFDPNAEGYTPFGDE